MDSGYKKILENMMLLTIAIVQVEIYLIVFFIVIIEWIKSWKITSILY